MENDPPSPNAEGTKSCRIIITMAPWRTRRPATTETIISRVILLLPWHRDVRAGLLLQRPLLVVSYYYYHGAVTYAQACYYRDQN